MNPASGLYEYTCPDTKPFRTIFNMLIFSSSSDIYLTMEQMLQLSIMRGNCPWILQKKKTWKIF